MAYVKTVDERTGKPVKFSSEAAIRRHIADLQRKQRRLIEGKTLKKGTPEGYVQRDHNTGIAFAEMKHGKVNFLTGERYLYRK